MAKQLKEVTLKITPCPDGNWFVQSESNANAFYKTNPTTGHCSCPSRKPCKHLRALAHRFAVQGTSLEFEKFDRHRYHVFVGNSSNRAVGFIAKDITPQGAKFLFLMPNYDQKGYNVRHRIVCESFDFCKLVALIDAEVTANV